MKTKDSCIFIPISRSMFKNSAYAKAFKFACSIDLLARSCDLVQIKKILAGVSIDPGASDETFIQFVNRRVLRHVQVLSENNSKWFAINSTSSPTLYKETLYPVFFFEEQLRKISGRGVTNELVDLFLEKIKEQKQIALKEQSKSEDILPVIKSLFSLKDQEPILGNRGILSTMQPYEPNIKDDDNLSMTKNELKKHEKQRTNSLNLDKISDYPLVNTLMKGNKRMDETPLLSCNKIPCVNQGILKMQEINNPEPAYDTVLNTFYKDVTDCNNQVNESTGRDEIIINTEESVSDTALNSSNISVSGVNEFDFFDGFFFNEMGNNSQQPNDDINLYEQDLLDKDWWN